jgi:hypothetical protein
MKLSRERTDTLFKIHAKNLQDVTKVVELEEPFTYQVTIQVEEKRDGQTIRQSKTLMALVFSCSWDYWEYRIALSAPAVALVICSEHNTCLPIDVLEIGSTGYHYPPREMKNAPAPGELRTKRTARYFVGALLSGSQRAFNELETMHPSSQVRYRRRLEQMLTKKRVGHPLSIAKELQYV